MRLGCCRYVVVDVLEIPDEFTQEELWHRVPGCGIERTSAFYMPQWRFKYHLLRSPAKGRKSGPVPNASNFAHITREKVSYSMVTSLRKWLQIVIFLFQLVTCEHK